MLDYELKSLTNPGFKHEAALVDRLKGNLTLAEVSCMIHLGDIKGVPVTTLGLDPEDVKTRTSAANRLIVEVVQSRRRPLLGPSPG